MAHKLVWYGLILLLAPVTVSAQSWPDTVKLLNQLLSRYPAHQPVGQLAISLRGQMVYSSARGMANLEHEVPLTTTSKIEAGSVSKQFTAACILLLEQQGKLSLQDDVHQYLPELPAYHARVTLGHMMHHTSGLKDFIPLHYLTGWRSGTHITTTGDMLALIARQKKLNYPPGQQFVYSNTNYLLLALVVERVSGVSLNAYSAKFIFEPAGMRDTQWRQDPFQLVPGRATAYSKVGGAYVTDVPIDYLYGHTGLLTTAEDLLRWQHFCQSGKLGSPSLLAAQTATSRLPSGRLNVYAAGVNVDSVNGWASIRHRGLTGGYRASLEHFPQLGLTIAWLSNNSQTDLSNLQPTAANLPTDVRNLLVPNRGKAPGRPDTTLPVTSFQPYLGAYRDAATGTGLQLAVREQQLFSDPSAPWMPLNAQTLVRGGQRLVFTSQSPRQAWLISPLADSVRYVGAGPAVDNEKARRDYLGEYYAEETGSTARVEEHNQGLVIIFPPHIEVPLRPVYQDGYSFRIENNSVAPMFAAFFQRDTRACVTTLIVSEPRAKGIRFVRKR